MLNIEDKIDKIKEYFKSQDNVLAAWLIGSYGTEFQREESDVDFAVLFNEKASIMEEMKAAGELSQIIEFEDVDIVNLNNAPITLQFKTLEEGRNVFERDYYKVCDFMEYVFNNYSDEKYYLDLFMKDFYESYNFRGDI